MDKPNLLTDKLPIAIDAGGSLYAINADFRIGIRFEQMMEDRLAETDAEKWVMGAFSLYFGEDRRKWARDLNAAMEQILWFYALGTLKDSHESEESPVQRDNRIYDYDVDAPYIYAAFLQAYGIDLQRTRFMHWWRFHALFRSLPDECKICKIMDIRGKDISDIKDAKERSRLAALKASWELPSTLTHEGKISRAGALFSAGIKSRGG